MVQHQDRNKFFSKIIAIVVISTLLFPNLVQNSLLDGDFTTQRDLQSNSILDKTTNNIESDNFKKRPISFAYTPIDQMGGVGDDLTVLDEVTVSHQVNLSLNSTNGYSDSFNIAGISGFTDDYLEYDMSISTVRDFYTIFESAVDNKDAILDSGQIRVAQGFTIPWDFGVFYGAGIYLDTTGPTLGSDDLELFIVKADGTGQPNMGDIRAFDINGPYNSSNSLPASSTRNYAYYDFANITSPGEDVILERGNYFVVANLSIIDDTGNEFTWMGQQFIVPAYRSYLHDGTSWSIDGETRDLVVDLKPSYSNGTTLLITDPTNINLQDNALGITSLNQQIVSAGLHSITSNTTVEISMNNSYIFNQILIGTTSFIADNSTYPTYDVSWEVFWNIPQIELTPYTNPLRNHYILTPNDWSNTVYSILLNDSVSVTTLRNPNGYECSILDLLSGNKYFEGEFKLQTSSPNYITSTQISNGVLVTKNFTLGYWTTDTIDAFGHEGSTVYVEVGINDIVQSGGILNFTLFDSSGEIIDWKNSSLLPPNLYYYDNSSYSGLGIFDPGDSVFKHNITIDPSINESDKEGEWTAFVIWENGTEVGLFSSTINVEKPTLAEFAWEETLGQNDMTNDIMTELTRINGHGISVEVDYYNISDPFFSGIGTTIVNASVTYFTSWGDSGSLVFDSSKYVFNIITDAPAGVYTVDLIASGPFLETQSVHFSVKILHQFDLSPVRTSYEVNYTNEVIVSFELRDISDGNALIQPDNIFLTFNGSSLDPSDYIYTSEDDRIKITIDTGDIFGTPLPPGNYPLLISASKTNFVSDYGIDTTVDSTYIVVTPIHTHIVLEDTVTTTNIRSQITISFRFIDMNHSVDIEDASLDVRFDIEGVELVSQTENKGLYTLIIKINEPSVAILNIFIDISKTGYLSQLNIVLTTVSIDLLDGSGIPIGVLIGIIIVIALGILGVVGYFMISSRIKAAKEERFRVRQKSRSIFQSTIMIKKILVVHHETSLPVFEKDIDMVSSIDPSIVTGVLQAISTIGMEMIGSATGIKKIEYYGFVIISAYSGAYTVYVFSETELDIDFEEGVANIARWFDLIFGYDSAQWDGSMDIYNEYRSSIEEKISEELYLWLLYPLSVSEVAVAKLEELSGIEQAIISFIKKQVKTSLLLILDKLDKFEDEEILEVIFKLVDTGLILKSNSD